MEYSKKQKYIVWGIIIAALLIRVAFVMVNGSNMFLGDLDKFDNDDVKYIRSGMILLEEQKLVYKYPDQATAFIGPVLPMILALVFTVFGSDMNGIIAFQVLQAIIGTLSVGLVYVLGRDFFNKKIGIIASLIYALEPTAVRNTGYILTETIFTFLLLLMVVIALRALKSKTIKNYVVFGIIWAIASLLKSAVSLLFGVIFVAMIFYKYKPREILKYSVVTCAVFVIVMSPWWVRNYTQFNRFIPFTASTGNPMILGTFLYNKVDKYDLRGYIYGKTEIEQNDIEVRVAKERITRKFKEDFWQYAYWYTIGKTIFFWKDSFYWKRLPLNNWDYIIFPAVHMIHYTLLILGIIGIILCIIKDFKKAILPLGIISYMNLIHLPFFVMSRYSFPVMTIMIIMGAYGIVKFIEIVKPIEPKINQTTDGIEDSEAEINLEEQVLAKH